MYGQFIASEAHAGYGARINVEVDTLTLALEEKLNELCKWGGSDKRFGNECSWEFGEVSYVKMLSYLKKNGYVQVSSFEGK